MSKTYGVGASAEKKNTGADVDQVSVLDDTGKVTNKGEVVFDPKIDKVEIQQADGNSDGTEEAEDASA